MAGRNVTTDVLRTEFEVVNQAAASAAIDAHYAKLKQVSGQVNSLESDINKALIKSHNLAGEFRELEKAASGRAGAGAAAMFGGLEKVAAEAERRMKLVQSTLRSIQATAARETNPVILDRLTRDAKVAQAELDKLERKIERVAANRKAGGTPGRVGFGGAANVLGLAGGLLPGGLGEAAGGAGLAADAAAGLGVTVSTGLLAAGAGLAAAGALFIKYSREARADAEARLAAEERIQGAINKTIIAQKDARKEFEKQSADAQKGREFSRELAGGSIDELRKRAELLKQLNELNPNGENAATNQEQRLAIEARIDALQQQKIADQDRAFEQRNENWKKAQEDRIAQEKRFEESVDRGIQKLEQHGEAIDDLFKGLFAAQGAQNPFVKVFNEADAAIEKTRTTTALLNDDLKATAEQMTATANANNLFAARLDSKLSASGLRADADRFRRAGEDEALAASIAAFRRQEQSGLFRNPDILASLGRSASPQARLDAFNAQREAEQAGGLFRNDLFDDRTRRSLALEAERDGSASERFQRQLDALREVRPENDEQRAILDRKIIELGRNLNEKELDSTGRDAIAQALENQAVRDENAERDAKTDRETQKKIQASIDANISELLKVAKADGLAGVIRIVNEAEDRAKISLGKRPTERDAAKRQEE